MFTFNDDLDAETSLIRMKKGMEEDSIKKNEELITMEKGATGVFFTIVGGLLLLLMLVAMFMGGSIVG